MIGSRSSVHLTKTPAPRRGLTLIELVVVLTILIALAGLLVPMLPSMLTRAHTSTCSTNMSETSRAITTYQQLYSGYPTNWDALTDGTTLINYLAGGQALPGWPAGQGSGMANSEVIGITLTAAEAANLTGVGITVVQPMVSKAGTAPGNGQPFDPTFQYYVNASNTVPGLPVAAGLVVGGMDPSGTGSTPQMVLRCSQLNLSPTGRYALLGIGPWNSMTGKTIQTAPVHFGDQPALNPEYGYQRFVAIFYISDTNTAYTITQARLVGTAPIHDTGVGSIQDELQNWYQLTTGGS